MQGTFRNPNFSENLRFTLVLLKICTTWYLRKFALSRNKRKYFIAVGAHVEKRIDFFSYCVLELIFLAFFFVRFKCEGIECEKSDKK